MVTAENIKELREMTGISVMQVKKALEEAGGDRAKALVLLQKKGGVIAGKKGDRALGAGVVSSYIHSTKTVGSIVLLSCETDFVAKNEEFLKLAYDIAMQVAATDPSYLSRAEVGAEAMEKARQVFAEESAGKPAELQETILKGKLDAYFKDKVLLEQPFIKDEEKTVKDLVDAAVQKFGERIEVTRVTRFSIK